MWCLVFLLHMSLAWVLAVLHGRTSGLRPQYSTVQWERERETALRATSGAVSRILARASPVEHDSDSKSRGQGLKSWEKTASKKPIFIFFRGTPRLTIQFKTQQPFSGLITNTVWWAATESQPPPTSRGRHRRRDRRGRHHLRRHLPARPSYTRVRHFFMNAPPSPSSCSSRRPIHWAAVWDGGPRPASYWLLSPHACALQAECSESASSLFPARLPAAGRGSHAPSAFRGARRARPTSSVPAQSREWLSRRASRDDGHVPGAGWGVRAS